MRTALRRTRTRQFLPPALATMGAGLLAAACGGSSPSAAPTTTAAVATTTPAPTTTTAPAGLKDPCALLTRAEAAVLAQTKLNPPIRAGNSTDQNCSYDSPPTGPTAQVEILEGLGVKKSLDLDRAALHHVFTTIGGVGDVAYEEAGNIFVRKGTLWAQISVVLLDVPVTQIQSGLVTAAKLMASRM